MIIQSVLMVDDDPDIRKICRLSLASVGKWRVQLAADGLEALELAAKERPDVVLLDVMMPGMDGPTTLSKLREIPSMVDVPVILMTAKVQTHEVEKYLNLGALGVIAKPFDPMTLPDQIKSLVEQRG